MWNAWLVTGRLHDHKYYLNRSTRRLLRQDFIDTVDHLQDTEEMSWLPDFIRGQTEELENWRERPYLRTT